LVAMLALVSGCATYSDKFGRDSRYWEGSYTEVVRITTEPPGCRIYCQDRYIGVSPIEQRIEAGKITVTQGGRFTVRENYDLFLGFWCTGVHESRGSTSWDSKLSGSVESPGAYTIKAYCEGYGEAVKVQEVSNQSDAFVQAVRQLHPSEDARLNAEVVGYRNLLLTLYPLGQSPMGSVQQQPSATQDQRRAEAQKEYDEALEAYNKALENLNQAKMTAALVNAGAQTPQSSNFGQAMSALGALSAAGNLTDARRQLEIARERLERAKSRIDAADWR